MKRHTRHITTDLAIIGAGLAGFAASIFALDRGLRTAQLGHTGAIAYTTGYLDLLGVRDTRVLNDPWQGLAVLRGDEPEHPLARLDDDHIRSALGRFSAALTEMGIGYTPPGERNHLALLPAGLAKPTMCVPATMAPGVEALRQRARTLILDFDGLPGFSAAEFKANFSDRWPELAVARIAFPQMEGRQLYPEVMARALEVPATRTALAERIKARLGGEAYVGLPAMLGMHAPDAVQQDMARMLGTQLFEIPTIPPAVPGIRLREMFERELPPRGLMLEPQLKVQRVEWHERGARLYLHGAMDDVVVETTAVILATGRFLSGGLEAARDGVRETLIGLPVRQPGRRDDWYRAVPFDPRGHKLNRAGIEVDELWRPLGADGHPFSERLFAAGAVLARQDWVRQRCGAGLAIATAFAAVKAASGMLQPS